VCGCAAQRVCVAACWGCGVGARCAQSLEKSFELNKLESQVRSNIAAIHLERKAFGKVLGGVPAAVAAPAWATRV
jgi:hypothetical protein